MSGRSTVASLALLHLLCLETRASEIVLGDASLHVTVETPATRLIEKYGPRFDTTGAVVSVKRQGKEFLVNEGITEEFNIMWIAPPGYAEAREGDEFLKIGVGNLTRSTEPKYFFMRDYAVARLAEVSAEKVNATSARVRQAFDSGLGWAYDYEKRYEVDVRKGELVVRYALRNTGKRVIEMNQYAHNWFRFGGEAPGPDYELTVPQKWAALPEDVFRHEGNRIALRGKAEKPLYYTGELNIPRENNFYTLANEAAGMRVEMRGDFAVRHFTVFIDAEAICPEIFGRWTVAPGAVVEWTRTYRFFITGK